MLYVIDTHVLIWYFTGNRRLSEDVRNTIPTRRCPPARFADAGERR